MERVTRHGGVCECGIDCAEAGDADGGDVDETGVDDTVGYNDCGYDDWYGDDGTRCVPALSKLPRRLQNNTRACTPRICHRQTSGHTTIQKSTLKDLVKIL